MAFKGGFLVKPSDSSVTALASLYMQGKQAINEKKQQLNKQTSESVAALTEATNFGATGIQDFDSMMIQYGNSTRNTAMELKQAFDKREISLSDFNAGMTRLTADSKIASQYPSIMKDQLKSIQDGIEKGDLSDINLELVGFFKDKNKSPNARNSSYQLTHVKGVPTYVRTYEYEEDGEIKTGTESVPVSTLIDPNRSKYRKVNLDSDVETFTKVLGDQGIYSPYEQKQVLNGATVYGKITDPTKEESVKKYIEERIQSYQGKDLVSIAYEELGFKAKGFSDFDMGTLKRNAQRRKGLFQDKDGNTIDYTNEDFILETNSNGDFLLTEKQEELVQSYLRNKHYSALDIKYEEKVIADKTQSSKTKEEILAGTTFTSGGYQIGSLAKILIDTQNAVNEIGGANPIKELKEISVEGKEGLATLKRIASGVGTHTLSSMVIEGDASKALTDAIKPSAFTGNKLSGVDGIVASKVGGRYDIVLVGPTVIGETEITREGEPVTRTAKSQKSLSSSMSSPLSSTEARKLYIELYKNADFADRASKAGYAKNTEDPLEAIYTIMEGYSLVKKQG